MSTQISTSSHRFDIALSFPGEHRRFVRNVADRLAEELGQDRVFYDDWYEAELLGLDGDLKLRKYYRDASHMVVPFFSEHYEKDWCQIEWSAIRAMLKDRRKEDVVIPVQMDLTSIPGWESIDFAIRRRQGSKNRSGKEVADLILQAYRLRSKSETPTIESGSSETSANVPVEFSRIVKYAPEKLIGRETETALLDSSWQKVVEHEAGRPRVLGFVALGGEGKTSLVAKWLAELAGKDWPGCESVFAWSFYSQGSREQVAVSSDLFLAEALKFFGDPEMAGSAQGAYEKGQRLAELVGGQRSLLILDGVEPLQYPPSSPTGSRLKDQGVEALLKGLAARSSGLCIVTTRYSIPDLAAFAGSTWQEEELKRLSREAGVALLKDCGVKGSERRSLALQSRASEEPDSGESGYGPLNEYEQLVEDVQGHALTLQILGQYLKRAHHGDIRRRDRVELAKADSKVHASAGFGTGHAFRAIAAYEAWLESGTGFQPVNEQPVSDQTPHGQDGRATAESRRELAVLRLLGLFDRPATADCVQALRTAPAIDGLTDPLVDLPDEDWEFTLSELTDARLVSVNRDEATGELLSLDAHPLIREYFALKLRGTGFQPVSQQPVSDQSSHGLEGRATVKRRQGAYLPHWTREGGIYSVTFRLADSLPASVISAWQREREEIIQRANLQERSLSSEESKRLQELFSDQVEKHLDSGSGECWMQQPEIARIVRDALLHFDDERYRLLAWCVMPNHVHVVVQPLPGFELDQILHSWKSFTANQANRTLARSGSFWQPEYYDHLIRDEEDLIHSIEYVLANPESAGLKNWEWAGHNQSLTDFFKSGTGFQPVNEPATHGLEGRATSDVWRAAHRRLYEHLCETTREGDQPTLEELQPLYQAVAHGCHAGLQQKALDGIYFTRIRRGNEHYTSKKLGVFGSDLGAVASFFEPPWSVVSTAVTDADQIWLINQAAFRLRALGRLAEALVPMRSGVEGRVRDGDWTNAARSASNLSELELTLGEVSGALTDAERSVTYADRSGDADMRMIMRTTHADALHQSGRRSEAESLFREAEEMQAERQPAYPLLYSTGGFRYCDLLLAPAVREAWRVLLRGTGLQPVSSVHHGQDGRATCRDVTDRATQARKIAERNNWLLDIALDHLTLSRAALYESLLSGTGFQPVVAGEDHGQDARATASREIEAAVSGLRRAGTMDHLPRALLTRAWQRSLLGRTTGPDSAQSDLDEAWEIASRGPMTLFLADIHLHRARLFGRRDGEKEGRGDKESGEQGDGSDSGLSPSPGPPVSPSPYPWKSVEHDLAEARRLIEKHGYGRRMGELEDAEEALLPRG